MFYVKLPCTHPTRPPPVLRCSFSPYLQQWCCSSKSRVTFSWTHGQHESKELSPGFLHTSRSSGTTPGSLLPRYQNLDHIFQSCKRTVCQYWIILLPWLGCEWEPRSGDVSCSDKKIQFNNLQKCVPYLMTRQHLSIDRKILLPGSVGPSFSMEAGIHTESPSNQRRLLDHNYMLILSYALSHFSIKAVIVWYVPYM